MSNVGNMALCMVCALQDRVEDNGQETICLHPDPKVDDDTCRGFRLLSGPGLGERLGELYSLLDVLTDVVYALADKLEQELRPAGFQLTVQLSGRALRDFTRLHTLTLGTPGDEILREALACYREFLEVGQAVEETQEEQSDEEGHHA